MGSRWETRRTEAFSDGVFAIAITLLVLDIRVPLTAFDDLWQAILDEWPAYLGYVTSFLTIGGFWLGHHAIFRRLRYADRRVMTINLLLLMAVAFLPFPTRLVADGFHSEDAERIAVIFYGLSLLVISILFSILWGTISRNRELLEPGVSDREVRAITLATSPSVGFYIGAVAVGIAAPKVAAIGYLVIAIVALLRIRGDREAAPA
jgi:uncharacterized membrane protein